MPRHRILTIDDPGLDDLCAVLAAGADDNDRFGDWPTGELRACADAGVYEWFVPAEHGGLAWSELDLHRAYVRLAAASLATTFCLTQPIGVARRLVASENVDLRDDVLPKLLSGDVFGAVGISQLTTSRRHLAKPALAARETADGILLDGFIPWVTGGDQADVILTGAVLDDGRQVLLLLPTDLPGVEPDQPSTMVGLNATHTGTVRCDRVSVGREQLLAGPSENVFGSGGAGTGGLQTSALAVGLATAAIHYLEDESQRRDDLLVPLGGLRAELLGIENDLFALCLGENPCSTQDLRTRANSLVLRATQAALAAAKGSGYVAGHPAGRWCREALFFLVWSCPQPVLAANLCELAGLSDL